MGSNWSRKVCLEEVTFELRPERWEWPVIQDMGARAKLVEGRRGE